MRLLFFFVSLFLSAPSVHAAHPRVKETLDVITGAANDTIQMTKSHLIPYNNKLCELTSLQSDLDSLDENENSERRK